MKRKTRFFTVLNYLASVLLLILLIMFIFEIKKTESAWTSIGFIFIGEVFTLIVIALFIPWTIYLVKMKFSQMKLYFYSQFVLILMVIITLLFGFFYN